MIQPRDLPPLPAQLKAEAEWLRHDGQKDDYYWLLERLKCTADLLDSAINALTPPAARPDANGNTVEFTQSPVLVNQSAAQADCTRSHPHEGMGPMCELKTQIAHLTNENAHLKARPAQALADERVALQTIVAGALFDFAGYLTTLPKPISIGSSELASPMVELLTAWAALRGLSLDDADVSTWQARAALAQQAAQAPCGTVTAYEDSTGQHYQFTPSWGWVGTRRFDVFEAPPAQAQQSDRVTPEMFQQLQEQVKTLKEIGERKIDGCECSAEDACRFAMERDEARALVAELKAQQAAGVPEASALVEALHKIKHKAVSLADAQVIALEALAAATEAAQVTDALKSARMATSQDDGRFRVVLQFTEFDDANAVHSWLMSQGVLHYNGPGSHATQAQVPEDVSPMQEQAAAGLVVAKTLNEIAGWWIGLDGTGQEKAVTAIKMMAQGSVLKGLK